MDDFEESTDGSANTPANTPAIGPADPAAIVPANTTPDTAAPRPGDDDFWGDDPEPAATGRPPKRRSWRTWLVAGVGAAAIGGAAVAGIGAASSDSSLASAAAGSNAGGGAGPGGFGGAPGAANGQDQGQGRPAAIGTISAIDGSTITVEDMSGQATNVTTTSSTVVTRSSGTNEETIDVSDLAVGDTVMVLGTTSNGTVTASRIRDGIPTGAGPLGGGPGGAGAGGAPPNGQSGGSQSGNGQSTQSGSNASNAT